MEEIDDFNGVTNEEFIEYFKVDLHSRMELINYTYPHELLDEHGAISEHLNRCHGILSEYMFVCYNNAISARWQINSEKELENDETEEDDTIELTPEEKSAEFRKLQMHRDETVKARYAELTEEIDKLVDDYIEKVKVTYIDL